MSRRFSPRTIPPAKAAGDCLVIWNPDIKPKGYARPTVIRHANHLLGTAFKKDGPFASVNAPIKGGWGRTVRLDYVLEPDGKGDCR
tara:strand:- start:114 stop:371 length:258 start_codon:yes stop_codon:yes gene_type:complete